MNEQIQKLAEQAFFDEATSRPSDKIYTFSDHKMAKFAELIVRECAVVADQWVDDEDNGHNLISTKLKEHFGVE